MTKYIDKTDNENEFNPFNIEVKHHEVISAKSGAHKSVIAQHALVLEQGHKTSSRLFIIDVGYASKR